MPVKSLVDLASAACIKNIRQLESVGDYLPYENVRHILLKVENAYQLRRIELNSPQIDGRTGELWLKLIEKDFPLEFRSKAYKPQNPSKWYKVWEKYKRDHDQAVEESEMKLKNALDGLQQDKEKNTSKIVERKLLPRKGRTGPRRGPRDSSSSALNFTGGSRTRTLNGASVMRKVRREVKEIATIHGSLSKNMGAPARQTQTGIKKPPQSMVNDHRRAIQPSNEPKKSAKVPPAVREYEDRATFISDSEDDQDDNLFDEPKRRPAPKPAPKPAKKSPAKPAAARSAAASLLKTRPAASSSRPANSTSGPRTAEPKPRPSVTSTSPVKSSGRPSSNQRPATPSTQAAESSLKSSPRPVELEAQPKAAPAPASSRPPTLDANAGPSSPPPPPRPPKRKGADIFMRPKKRVH